MVTAPDISAQMAPPSIAELKATEVDVRLRRALPLTRKPPPSFPPWLSEMEEEATEAEEKPERDTQPPPDVALRVKREGEGWVA